MNILELKERKKSQSKLTMVTCYDAWSAKLIAQTPIDMILVGDSAAMVMHGYQETIPATIDLMAIHIAAVRKGAPKSFVVGDMPFLSYRGSVDKAVESVQKLMQAGANCIKLEGCSGNEAIIQHLVASGVPVMGHLGLTPQSVNTLGGNKVQGREQQAKKQILEDAKNLENAGCFSLVLECVPAELAAQITAHLQIPTIGIGAGPNCDGQVLVLQDMLGLSGDFKPKFLRQYLNGGELIKSALEHYHQDVQTARFPNSEESYS